MEEEVSAAHNQPRTSPTKLGNKVFTTILDCYTIQLRGSQVSEQVKKEEENNGVHRVTVHFVKNSLNIFFLALQPSGKWRKSNFCDPQTLKFKFPPRKQPSAVYDTERSDSSEFETVFDTELCTSWAIMDRSVSDTGHCLILSYQLNYVHALCIVLSSQQY